MNLQTSKSVMTFMHIRFTLSIISLESPTFRTCFFSPFSSFNDEKIKLTLVTVSESQLVTTEMFNLMTKKKLN